MLKECLLAIDSVNYWVSIACGRLGFWLVVAARGLHGENVCVMELKQIAMNRMTYEAPVTERFSVELEGVFCSSIIIDKVYAPGAVEAEGHDVNNDLNNPDGWGDFNDNFKVEGWQ